MGKAVIPIILVGILTVGAVVTGCSTPAPGNITNITTEEKTFTDFNATYR